jgi:tyrosyl-tRNA synthetase
MKMVPSINLNGEVKLIDLLVDNGICSSRREAREMLTANAISINNEKYTDENAVIDKTIAIDGKVIVIRKGKKKQFIGIFE